MGQSRPRSGGRQAPGSHVIVVYGRGEPDGYVVAAFAAREDAQRGIERYRTFALPGYGAPSNVIDAGGGYFAINGVERPGEGFEIVALPRDDEAYGHIWRRFIDAATPTGRDLLRGVLPEPRCPLAALGGLMHLSRDEGNIRYVLKTFAVVFDRGIEREHGDRRAGVYLWGSHGGGVRKFVVVPQYDRNERVAPLFMLGHQHPIVDRFVLG